MPETGVETRDGMLLRLAALTEDPLTCTVLCQRVADGESVREVARAWAVPPGRLLGWLMEDRERWASYLAAKQAWVHGLIDEVVGIADREGEVPRDKLRIDTRLRLATAFAPEVFGRESGGGGSKTQVNVVVQRGGPDEHMAAPSTQDV